MTMKVAVAGASGYAGGELLRLIAAHPQLELSAVTAHSQAGQLLGSVHAGLPSLADLRLLPTEPASFDGAELVFLALPHGASGPLADQLPSTTKVVDLGSDHRLVDASVYSRYYSGPHRQAWTYGLPELPGQRALISKSERVANTGCHAVAAILALAPLLAAGVMEAQDAVVVSASGTSGAGRAAAVHLLASEVMGEVSAYKVGSHRHVPEIKQASAVRSLTFTPLLVPMPRGILSTVSVRPRAGTDLAQARQVLLDAYRSEPFVHVLPGDTQPRTSSVSASNSAALQIVQDADSGRFIVTVAIDNLGKGAAGQAVQLANLMLGLAETEGLSIDGVTP